MTPGWELRVGARLRPACSSTSPQQVISMRAPQREGMRLVREGPWGAACRSWAGCLLGEQGLGRPTLEGTVASEGSPLRIQKGTGSSMYPLLVPEMRSPSDSCQLRLTWARQRQRATLQPTRRWPHRHCTHAPLSLDASPTRAYATACSTPPMLRRQRTARRRCGNAACGTVRCPMSLPLAPRVRRRLTLGFARSNLVRPRGRGGGRVRVLENGPRSALLQAKFSQSTVTQLRAKRNRWMPQLRGGSRACPRS